MNCSFLRIETERPSETLKQTPISLRSGETSEAAAFALQQSSL